MADGRPDIGWRFSSSYPAQPEAQALNDRICIVDCRDGRTREAFPAAPQLSSVGSPWEGIRVERHRLPRFTAPEVMLLEPFLTVTVEGGGELHFRRDGRTEHRVSRPGFVCVLGPGHVPEMHVGGPSTTIFISLRSWMLAEGAADILDTDGARLRNAYSVPDAHFFHIAMALSAEIEQGYPGGRLYGESLATALMTHLLAGYSEREPIIDLCKGGMGSRRLRMVLDYIEGNLTNDLSLAELGAVVKMSPCRFARVFKAAIGVPPHQFVLRKRIARARELLEASAAPLAEISASLGFESQSHFTATFHRFVGTTPAVYRDSRRQ
jgi:AraC family transcriptional regulator